MIRDGRPQSEAGAGEPPRLARRIPLASLTLYGLGTTIGAGIYVVIGEAVARAGYYTPLAFLAASTIAAFSAASFAELACRFPVSAGEAAYVREGLGLKRLALILGLAIVAAGCVSSATLLRGGAGYLGTFVEAPGWLLFVACLAALSGLAAWGVTQSVGTAAALSVVEIGGLLLIIGSAPDTPVDMVARIIEAAPPFDLAAVASISAAALLAFFAFIGFEDMVNVAEEVIDPRSVFPKAIGLTLAITALLYMGVSVVAVTSVPLDMLAQSDAPLATLFEHLTGWGTGMLSAIAIVAVLNGVLIQLVMATRILYGLSRQGQLPALLGRVSPVTHTPLAATALVTVVILAFGLSLPLAHLAEITSVVTLTSFALVNLSLWRLKRTRPQPADVFAVPQWVPLAGFATSGLFLALELGRRVVG